MMLFGKEIALKLIAYVVGGLLLVGLVLFTLSQCQQRRSLAAQTRLEHAQGDAQTNSAADAVNTVSRSGEAQAASEELTRKNEEEIRNAKGSDAKVDPAVRDAGIRSLCRRAAYRDSERCRLLKPHP